MKIESLEPIKVTSYIRTGINQDTTNYIIYRNDEIYFFVSESLTDGCRYSSKEILSLLMKSTSNLAEARKLEAKYTEIFNYYRDLIPAAPLYRQLILPF